MRVERRVWSLNRWQTITLIVLQLLFAACATSVLIYRAQGWAPEVINFGWLSYRACNIYISLALVAYFVVGLWRGHRYIAPLLTLFVLFHLVEGAIIGFWTKAILQLAALGVLSWSIWPALRTPAPLKSSSTNRAR